MNETKKGLSAAQMKIVRLAGNRRPIASSAYLNKIYGVAYGTFYNQLLYWEGKQHHKDGWIKKSKDEMYDETGVTEYQQDSAVKLGIKLGFLTQRIMSIPATRHLIIDVEKFLEVTANEAESKKLVAARYLTKFPEKPGTNIDKTTQNTTTKRKGKNFGKKDTADIGSIINARYSNLKKLSDNSPA